jgi:hypothetical protein
LQVTTSEKENKEKTAEIKAALLSTIEEKLSDKAVTITHQCEGKPQQMKI